MKKETEKKSKKWLWLAIGIVALLAVVGVVLGIVLGMGGSGDDAQLGGRPDLYWNVDKDVYMVETTGGIAASSREPAPDGYYYIRFAYNGEQVEYPVADKKLVNTIDSMSLMGLVFDGDGVIVDAKLPNEVAVEVGLKLYIQSAAEDKLVTNTSISMNGMKNEVTLSELVQIYNVSNTTENVGEIIDPSKLEVMDTVHVYGNNLGEITHIYFINRSEKSAVYWRYEQKYSSALKSTTRVPDENGVYTVDFYCDGEIVALKFKDEELVTTIDATSRYSPCFSFTFDEDGYVTGKIDTGIATRTVQRSARYDVSSITDGFVETVKVAWSNAGATDSFYVDENTVVYDVSKAAVAEGRDGKQVEGLQVGDRIVAWTDANGVAKLVYISNRVVDDAFICFGTDRKYDATLKETTRVPDANGWYYVEVLKDGELITVKTQDKALMSLLDSFSAKVYGLKLKDGTNEIQYVYDSECIFGISPFGQGRYVDELSGIVVMVHTMSAPDDIINGVLLPDAKIYNVSIVGEYGELTTVRPGDYVYLYKQPTGEIVFGYVIRRIVDTDIYYNLERKYDSTNKVTTRVPDENGWYVYTMAVNGKQVTVKTQSKDMATYVDSTGPGILALIVDSNGVIQEAYPGQYAVGGYKRSSGYTVTSINADGTVTTVSSSGTERILTLSDDCKVWNVCQVYNSHRGEVGTLKVGDVITALTDTREEAAVIFIREREVDNMYINKNRMYDDTNGVSTREPDANGWYWYELAVNGKVKTFKTNDVEIANKVDYYGGGFGLVLDGDVIKNVVSPSYVKDVKTSGVTNWDVTAVNGNKVTVTYHSQGSSNDGKSQTFTLASNAKIYDASPTTDNFGAEVKLQVGDRIRTYINEDDEALYVYIKYHNTREKGALSYCEHCGEVVYWSPWVGGSFASAGGHFYLPMDVTTDKASSVGRSATKIASDVVLDLNGYTYCRTTSRAIFVNENATFSLMDTAGGGKLTAVGSESSYGGVIYVSQSTFNLYSGTLTPAQDNVPGARGGVVYMTGGAKAVFNMYGGTITGGETAPTSEYAYSQGGNLFVNSGVFNMYGGTISGGTSHDGKVEKVDSDGNPYTSTIRGMGGNVYSRLDTAKVNIYGGTIENGTAYGGGNVSGAGQWTLSGGTISGGEAAYRGGSFYISDGNWEFSGVTVKNGESVNRGGNIYITSPTAEDGEEPVYSVVTVSGGTISGGKAGTDGDNIAVVSGSIFNMTGGTVSGGSNYLGTGTHTISGGKLDGLTEYKGGELTISGKPVFTNLMPSKAITVGALTNGAQIAVTASGTFTNELTGAESYIPYFTSLTEGTEIGVVENALAVVKEKLVDPNAYTAMCEHCDEMVEWSEWAYLSGSGHYYLADNISITEEAAVIANGEDIILDLAGKTVTATDVRAFDVTGTLSVVDSVGNGTVIGNGLLSTSTVDGGVIRVNNGGVMNLYSGTVCLAETHNPVRRGGVMLASSGAQINILGGIVSGGEVQQRGGNIYTLGGEVNISGGLITDGVLLEEGAMDYGGNIGVGSNGSVNISGGEILHGSVCFGSGTHTISGGTINGKVNVYNVDCLVTVSGAPVVDYLYMYSNATIAVGALTQDAHLVIDADGVFTSTVENAQTSAQRFEAYATGYEVTVVEGALAVTAASTEDPNAYDAACPHCNGENANWTKWTGAAASGHYYLDGAFGIENAEVVIASDLDMVLDLKGQTLTATDVRAFLVQGKLSILDSATGGTIIGNGAYSTSNINGGVIQVTGEDAQFDLYSGTLEMAADHNDIYRGGLIYVTKRGVANIRGGSLLNGISTDRGGNIEVVSNSFVNIYGGTITGGKPYNMYLGSGTHTISGGTITGQISTYTGSNITVSGAPNIDYLTVHSSILLTVGELTGDASITVDASGTFTNVCENAESMSQYFHAYAEGYKVDAVDNALAIVEDTTGGDEPAPENLCPCGCGKALDAIQWTSISFDADPTAEYKIEAAGHYRLDSDVRGNTTNLFRVYADDVVFDLNGKTIANKGRAFYHADKANCDLYILDIVGGATFTTIDYDDSNKNNGALTGCWIATKGNVSVYGGSWSSTTTVAGTNAETPRMIYVNAGKLNIYGGTFDATGVVGGHGIMGAYKETASTFNISGGTFIGGDGNGVGDVWTVNAASTLNISGGTFQGKIYAKAAGSTISLSGAPVIDDLDLTAGAKLTLGELTQGAEITVKATKDTAITDALTDAASYTAYFKAVGDNMGVVAKDNKLVVTEICPCGCGIALDEINWTMIAAGDYTDTYKITADGHYRLAGNFNMLTSTKHGITATEASINNVVFDFAGHTMNITDGNGVRFGNSSNRTATFYIIDSVGSGGIVSTNVSNAGAGIYNYATTYVYGGTFSGSATSKANGGVIYNNQGTLTIYGGTIDASMHNTAEAGETAAKNGGAIYSTGDVIIEGGQIIGGSVTGYGDAIGMNKSGKTLTIKGGTITGQIFINDGAVSVSGKPVISNLDLTNGVMVTLGELAEGASIAVTAGTEAFSVANEKAADYATYFDAVADGKTVQANTDNQLVIVDEVAAASETESQSVFALVMRSVANFFGL